MVALSAIAWYILPGLLGRAYDLKNETVGPDIFDVSAVSKPRVIQLYRTITEYKVVSDWSEASDFLDVTGKLSLKIKTGSINIEGTGNYLKDSSSFDKRIDLLIKVHYDTVTTTLPLDIKPRNDWEQYIVGTGNTHYIRSISYGGELLASISFIANSEADKEIIRGEIQGEFSTSSGAFGGGLKGSLDKIKKKTKDTAAMNINYYATVPLKIVASDIDRLIQLVEEFPDEAKKINDGWGVPMTMEVFSLENFVKGEDFKPYSETKAYKGLMAMLDEQFTDFRDARRRLVDWMKTIPPILPESETQKIGKFASKLDELNNIYSKVVADMDLSETSSPTQFKEAFDAYSKDIGYVYPNLYFRELTRLKASVLENTPSLEADFGGGQYSYWGSNTCPNEAVLIYNGILSSTNSEAVGSSKFLCLPEQPKFFSEDMEASDDDIIVNPKIKPAVFISRKSGSNENMMKVACARCRVPGRSSVTVLFGMTQCPGTFTKQYEGVLVSTEHQYVRGELICLDVSKDLKSVSDAKDMSRLVEVSPKCGEFPCVSNDAQNKAIPCVVCSAKKVTLSKADILRH